MKKRIRLPALLLSLLLLAGCAAAPTGSSPAPSASPEQTAGTGDTRTITDAAGRQVEIPGTVSSVVCVGVCTLRYTTYLQAQDLIVGVESDEVGVPITKPFSYFNQDLFASLPITGNNGETYDEEILKVNPDVIIANTDADSAQALQDKTGIPVVVVPLNEGMFDDNVFQILSILGEVYHKEDRAEELSAYLKGIQTDLAERTAGVADEDKPTVYVSGVSFKGSHGFEGTEAGYAPLAAINGVNLADTTGQTSAFSLDPEQVLTWDPDVIFVDFNGLSLINEDYASNPDFYNSLTAVQEGRVYSQISFRYSATNTELALADAYYMGKVLYPEQFADVDVAAKFDEIFETMLGVEDAYAQYQAAGYEFKEMTLGE